MAGQTDCLTLPATEAGNAPLLNCRSRCSANARSSGPPFLRFAFTASTALRTLSRARAPLSAMLLRSFSAGLGEVVIQALDGRRNGPDATLRAVPDSATGAEAMTPARLQMCAEGWSKCVSAQMRGKFSASSEESACSQGGHGRRKSAMNGQRYGSRSYRRAERRDALTARWRVARQP